MPRQPEADAPANASGVLYDEAIKAKSPVSLATIYNSLHQFTDAGLVQQIAFDGSKAFFDTNTAAHYHFFISGEHDPVDIPAEEVVLGKMPEPRRLQNHPR